MPKTISFFSVGGGGGGGGDGKLRSKISMLSLPHFMGNCKSEPSFRKYYYCVSDAAPIPLQHHQYLGYPLHNYMHLMPLG